ncbi:hypothetical protein [Streptomyces sp. NPDC060194]|uniref:hypothetical protein n=1 Tax=Streptomyces sp. NPDC060194 TaxID=3347069 RepID=UPI003663F865
MWHDAPRELARTVPVQTVVTFVLVAALIRLARPDRPVAWWLAESAVVTAVAVTVHLSRRRGDSRAVEVTERELPPLERALRQGAVPDTAAGRHAMRRLVRHRSAQLERTAWLLPVFLCFLAFAPVIYAFDGSWLRAAAALVLVTAFGWFLVAMRRRNHALLRRMMEQLDDRARGLTRSASN